MKKILQISNYFYPDIGGIENTALEISNAIRGKYIEKILCFSHSSMDLNDCMYSSEIIRCGTDLKLFSQQLSISIIRKIAKLFNDYNPDILIIHTPNPFLEYLILHNITLNVRLIVYWHSDIVRQKVGDKIFHNMTMKLLNRADCIIATSEEYIDGSKYLSNNRDKCVVVSNCIDEDRLIIDDQIKVKIDKIRSDNRGKTICLGIGRQVPYKGFEYLIKSMKKLNSNFELYLIGSRGKSTSAIEKLVHNMNNVHLLGEVNNSDKNAYLAACDIFCFSSITKNEAFGIALAEAMYFYKPSVTFNIDGSGVNYVSPNGVSGISVENRNISEYASAIKLLAYNDDIRYEMGQKAGQRVRKLFLSTQYRSRINNIISLL